MYFRGKYFFLSNMETAQIQYEGLIYPSVENAFQASKTLTLKERIRFTTINSWQSKNIGRKIKLRNDWETVKVNIMKELVTRKFFDNKLLKRKLLELDPSIPIVEENHWNDTFWGICNGIGENQLGKIIDKVRLELLNEIKKNS
jgi:hypothetical protein